MLPQWFPEWRMRVLALAVGVLVWSLSGAASGQVFSMEDISASNIGADEGQSRTFRVLLSAAVASETRVQYTIKADADPRFGTGFTAEDLDTPVTGVITFAPNLTVFDFMVRHAVDADAEANEAYLFTISTPAGGTGGPTVVGCTLVGHFNVGTGGCQTGDINSNGARSLTEFDVNLTADQPSPTEVAEGDTVRYTLSLDPRPLAVSQDVRLNFTLSGGLSTDDLELRDSAGMELRHTSGRLSLDEGYHIFSIPRASPSIAFQIAYLRDSDVDGGEQLAISLDTGGTPTPMNGANLPLNVTIANASPSAVPLVSISAPDDAAIEGGNATFRIGVDRAIAGAITVRYEVSASGAQAASAGDFGDGASPFPSGNITISPSADGNLPFSMLDIPIYDDEERELSAETFRVTLSNLQGQGAVFASAVAEASIALSDLPTITRVFGISGPAQVAEGAAATYTVSFTGPAPSRNINVTWNITGDNENLLVAPGTLVFAPADGASASKTFDITAMQNTLGHSTRSYQVTLNEPTGGDPDHGDYRGVNGSVTTSITDDDVLHAHFSTATFSAVEGGNAMLAVRLSGVGGTTGSADAVQVSYSVATGSADAGDFSVPDPASITLAAGVLNGVIPIPITDDPVNEGVENFSVTLSGAAGANAAVAPAGESRPITAAVGIEANDETRISHFLAPDADTVFEGDAAQFTIVLAGGHPTANILLDYTISGTVDAADYTGAATGRFTITPADAAAARRADNPQPLRIAIALVDDGDEGEPPETLIVTLNGDASSGGGGGLGIAPSVTPQQITIPEDVPRSTLRIDPANPNSQPENDLREFRFPVTLQNPPPGTTVTVGWAVLAPHTSDLAPNTGALTFNPGERRKFIVLNPVEEAQAVSTAEPAERFTVQLRNAQPASGANRVRIHPDHDDATAIILRNAAKAQLTTIYVTSELSSPTLNEGGVLQVTLKFQKVSGRVNGPREERYLPICIGHEASGPRSHHLRTALGNNPLAGAGDIRVTDVPGSEGHVARVRGGGLCVGSSPADARGRATIVDVRIPRDFVTSESPIHVRRFQVHAIADAAAEGPEVIWIAMPTFAPHRDEFQHLYSNGNIISNTDFQLAEAPIPNAQIPVPYFATINANAAATRVFSLAGPSSVAESDSAPDYMVSLAGAALGSARTMTWEVVGSGANPVQADDFIVGGATTGSLTFPAGDNAGRTFSLPAFNDDNLNEAAEQFTVHIRMAGSDLHAERAYIGADSVTTTLTDDDAVTLSVADAAQVAEGGTSSFIVTVGGGARPGALRVAWRVQAAATDSAAMADFRSGRSRTFPSGFVRIAPDASSGVISIPNYNDGEAEGAENFEVVITASADYDPALEPLWPPGVITVGDDTAAGSIAPSDLPVTVTLAEPAAAAEGTTAVFVLQTNEALDADLVVAYRLSGTASRGLDYTHPDIGARDARNTTYTLSRAASAAADTQLVFRLPQDNLNESDETIAVILVGADIPGAPQAAMLGPPGQISRSVEIEDDDPIRVEVSGNAADVAEGLSAQFTLELSDGGDYIGEVMVPWQVMATQASGDTDAVAADFDADADGIADGAYPGGVLTVPARGNAILNIPIFADGDDTEPDEKFALRLFGSARQGGTAASGGGGGAIYAQNPTPLPTGAILSSANAVRVSVSLSGPFEVVEGDTADYTVTLSGITTPSADIVVPVQVRADGDAVTADAAGADFMGGAIPVIGTLTFTPLNWRLPQSFSIATREDSSSEPTEFFEVRMNNPTGNDGNLILGTLTVLTRIADDDPLTIELGDASVAEGATARLPVTIRGGTPGAALTVEFVATGGSTADGDDYTLSSPQQVAAAGDTAGGLSIDILDDDANEASETLELRLTAVSSSGGGVVTLGGDGATAEERNATLTITDNDPVIVGVTAARERVPEDAGNLAFHVTLGGGLRAGAVSLAWTASGSATFGVDYTGVGITETGTLTFAASESSKTLTFAIADDSIEEIEVETIVITASGLAGAGLPGEADETAAEARVSILPSDIITGPTVLLGQAQCPNRQPRGCLEGNVARFPVTLLNPPPGDVTVDWHIESRSPSLVLYGFSSGFGVTDFGFDEALPHSGRVTVAQGVARYTTGDLLFRANERERRQFIEIELRFDHQFPEILSHTDAVWEDYDVVISVAPTTVAVPVNRVRSSIGNTGVTNRDNNNWYADLTFTPPSTVASRGVVHEGERLTVTITPSPNSFGGGNPELRTGPEVAFLYRICIAPTLERVLGDVLVAAGRGADRSRARASAADIRVEVGGAVKRVVPNVVLTASPESSTPRLTHGRCHMVDVEIPARKLDPITFDIEILADGEEEREELLFVFGVDRVEGGRTHVLTGVVLRWYFDTVRFSRAEQRPLPLRNITTIAASPADTRALVLTGATSVAEAGGAQTYRVAPDIAFTAPATATWSLMARGTTPTDPAADFAAATGTVTFPAGSVAAQMFQIEPVDDVLNEPGELFTLQVAMNDRVAQDGTGTAPGVLEGTLTDDDPVTLRMANARRVPEGDVAIFPVSLSGGERGGPLLLSWSVVGSGSAQAQAADFESTALPRGLLVIPAEMSQATVVIPIAVDVSEDDNEQFTLTATVNSPGGNDADAWSSGVLNLVNPAVTGSIGAPLTALQMRVRVFLEGAVIPSSAP